MKDARSRVLLFAICLFLGIIVAIQFRSRDLAKIASPSADTGQAAYIGRLYDDNATLQQQADHLADQLAQYNKTDASSTNNLDSMQKELQDLQMANGQVEAIGPGVTVTARGNLTVFNLQDLVDELHNASAEAVAVNGVRVVARSAITANAEGKLTIDRQVVSSPYRLDAIGEPDTLYHAVERKGGLIALLMAGDPNLNIQVTEHAIADKASWLHLPKTTADFEWLYGQAVPAP